MVFSSGVFLLVFLPITFIVNWLVGMGIAKSEGRLKGL